MVRGVVAMAMPHLQLLTVVHYVNASKIECLNQMDCDNTVIKYVT